MEGRQLNSSLQSSTACVELKLVILELGCHGLAITGFCSALKYGS